MASLKRNLDFPLLKHDLLSRIYAPQQPLNPPLYHQMFLHQLFVSHPGLNVGGVFNYLRTFTS